MSISLIHFGSSDLFMMVSFMYSLNVDVILQILLPIIWILPLITWASTLRRVSLWLYRSALQVFTFSHWSHSSSSGCQASNHSSNRFFLGMSMLLFKFSTTRVNYSPLSLHFSPLASVQMFLFQKFTFLYWSHWSAYSVLESVEAWGGGYIQESDLSVVVIKDVHFDFLVISVNVLCQILLLGIYILPFITLVNGAPLCTP